MKAWLKNITPRNNAPEGETSQPLPVRPRRKSVVPFWRRPTSRVLGALAVVGTLGGVGTWLVHSGVAEASLDRVKWAMIKTTSEQGFTVEDVLVTGRVETPREDLLAALNVARGAPILAYDFEAARTRVEDLPWVLSARIERLLPDTLAVHLIERRPMALWQHEGKFALIDEEGVVIQRDNLARFGHMLHIVGADAPDHVGGLMELLDTQPNLKGSVKAAVRVGGRRWDLMLEGGVQVRLPESGAPQALARLTAFDRDTGVLGREVKTLDLRVPDRVIVQSPAYKKPDKPKRKQGQQT